MVKLILWGNKMKTIYLIGGTMGVGKTTVCQQLKQDLFNSVFLNGDCVGTLTRSK